MISELAHLGPVVAWLLNFFTFSSVIILAALGIERLCPESWGIRMESVWKLCIPLSLVGATLLLNPGLSEHTPVLTIGAVPAVEPVGPSEPPAIKPSSTVVSQVPVVAENRTALSLQELLPYLWLLYSAAVLVGLGRFARDITATRKVQREARTLRDTAILEQATLIAQKAGISTPVIAISKQVPGPSTFLNNTICLPPWALHSLSEQQLQSMLAHEVAHVSRRDVMWSVSIRVLQVLLPFQPLLGLVKQRIAYHAELACDDWSARITGKPMALAQTLGQCAENLLQRPTPALAAGMADSQLVARVRRLTSREPQQPSYPVRTLVLMAALGAAGLAFVPGIALSKPESSERSVEVVEDDSGRQRGNVRLRNDERKLSFKYEGEIQFNDTFDDVASLDEDGIFRLSDRYRGVHRELELEVARDGSLVRDYEVNGSAADWDKDAQDWFAEIVQLLVRETGMALEQRLAYLLANGGGDAVVDEIALIKSDYIMRRYVVELSSSLQLSGDQLGRLLGIMDSDLQSDYEQRTALTAIWLDQPNALQVTPALLKAAKSVQSDYEARVLAEAVANTMNLDEASVARWLELVDTIQSDFEMRTAMVSLLTREDMRRSPMDAALVELLRTSREIQSDFEQRVLLTEAAQATSLSEAAGLAYVSACSDVQSDFEMREAVTALVEAGPPSDDVWLGLINLVRTDISGHEAAETLIAMIPQLPASSEVQAAFDRAKSKLSRHNRERVDGALASY